jgi:hypothetical protein
LNVQTNATRQTKSAQHVVVLVLLLMLLLQRRYGQKKDGRPQTDAATTAHASKQSESIRSTSTGGGAGDGLDWHGCQTAPTTNGRASGRGCVVAIIIIIVAAQMMQMKRLLRG